MVTHMSICAHDVRQEPMTRTCGHTYKQMWKRNDATQLVMSGFIIYSITSDFRSVRRTSGVRRSSVQSVLDTHNTHTH